MADEGTFPQSGGGGGAETVWRSTLAEAEADGKREVGANSEEVK